MYVKTGFTMIELLIVVALVGAIAGIGVSVYVGMHREVVLETTAEQIQQVLRLARHRAVAQQGGLGWGVHFANPASATPWYSICRDSPCSTAGVAERYLLPAQVRFDPASLAVGATRNIEFMRRTGNAVSAATIVIELVPGGGARRTISVSLVGLIDIE